MHSGLALVPLITMFTGGFVGWVLVRMLFYPKKPQKLSWFTFQGFVPSQQQTIASKLGGLLGGETSFLTAIEEKLTSPENFGQLMPVIETHVDDFLRVKLPAKMPMIGMLVGERTINEMKTVFIAELKELFPVVMKNYMNGLQTGIAPAQLISGLFERLSDEKSEVFVQELVQKAGKKAAVAGLLIGFLAGMVQVLLLVNA